jgi:hypothetical protein
MLDLIGIAFSGVMILYVLYRAVMLDRSQPWFGATGRRPARSRGSSR